MTSRSIFWSLVLLMAEGRVWTSEYCRIPALQRKALSVVKKYGRAQHMKESF